MCCASCTLQHCFLRNAIYVAWMFWNYKWDQSASLLSPKNFLVTVFWSVLQSLDYIAKFMKHYLETVRGCNQSFLYAMVNWKDIIYRKLQEDNETEVELWCCDASRIIVVSVSAMQNVLWWRFSCAKSKSYAPDISLKGRSVISRSNKSKAL